MVVFRRFVRKGYVSMHHNNLLVLATEMFKIDIKNFMVLFYGYGSTASRLQNHDEKIVYFLPFRSRKFLVLI